MLVVDPSVYWEVIPLHHLAERVDPQGLVD